jgi:hypothetical protein
MRLIKHEKAGQSEYSYKKYCWDNPKGKGLKKRKLN